MADINELVNQCESALSSALGLAIHVVKTTRFNRENPQHLFSILLLCRHIELNAACKALLEKGTLVGIPILLRSIFEAECDLRNVMQDANYHKRMYATFLKEKLRLIKASKSGDSNPYLTQIVAIRNLDKDQQAIELELNGLKSGSFGPLSVHERASLAGKRDEYDSVYNLLCLDTHNNIRSLESWHLESRSPTDYKVMLFKREKNDLLAHLASIPCKLIAQSKAIVDFLGIQDIDFTTYDDQVTKLQQAMKNAAEIQRP